MMKPAINPLQAVEHGGSLEHVKRRFADWRAERKPGARIPNALWAAAVGLVESHGLQRTAQELRVDSGQLKKRAAGGAAPTGLAQTAPRFVELFAQPALNATPTAGCVVVMERASGGKMRIELGSLDGLAGLTSAFWSTR